MKMIAEYRPLIRSVIAEIINSLSNSDEAIHWECTYTLSNLSQQGKVVFLLFWLLLITIHSRIAIFDWPGHSCDC